MPGNPCLLSCPLPSQELASGATLADVKALLNSILPSWLAEFARLLGKPLSADVSGPWAGTVRMFALAKPCPGRARHAWLAGLTAVTCLCGTWRMP